MSAVMFTSMCMCWQVHCIQIHASGHSCGDGRHAGESVSRVSWVMILKATPASDLRSYNLRASEFVLCDLCIWFGNRNMCLCVSRLMPELAEDEVPPVLFQSLLPPDADRRAVSNIFHRLLGEGINFSYHQIVPLLVVEIVFVLQHQRQRKLGNKYVVGEL